MNFVLLTFETTVDCKKKSILRSLMTHKEAGISLITFNLLAPLLKANATQIARKYLGQIDAQA
jgi:uncharacterized SAM-dependent methyltransferase